MQEPNDRRQLGDPNAPRVDIHQWAAGMTRRAEAQFRRDWTFIFTLWNYLFRTMVNLQKNAYVYAVPDGKGGKRMLTNKEIAEAARELLKALAHGKYRDISGVFKAVNKDFTKLRYVPELSDAARRLLDNIEARSRNIPGTHEVRKIMRQQTHAYRVCHGTSLFVTFSPSERDTTLMLKLARARQGDPAVSADENKIFQSRQKPELDVEFYNLSPEELVQALPDYDERKKILARDPLACAEGFQTLVLLTLRHIFGVRYCSNCPNCAVTASPCVDGFGSNATPTGGVFGRVDAVYGSIECQRSGSLHGHFQVFVQCVHQHGSMADLTRLSDGRLLELLRKYSSYASHVTRKIYCNLDEWQAKHQEAMEEDWPEYRTSTRTLSRPGYQACRQVNACNEWCDDYLNVDVEDLQKRKQHHVHLPQAPDGPRLPLAHCRDHRDPAVCKSGFPRDSMIVEQALGQQTRQQPPPPKPP